MRLQGEVALVTGGARGIGREIALALAREGAKVAIVDVDQENGEQTAQELKAASEGVFIKADIREVAGIRDAVERVRKEYGAITILINNAGISIRARVDEVTEEDWDRINDINLKAAFFFSQEVGKIMMGQNRGRMVNVASIRGHLADLTHSTYSITKAGMHALTRSFALSLAPYKVQVNSVSPGYVLTPMTEHNLQRPGWLDQLRQRVPTGKPVEMREVAEAVLFLVSGHAGSITGQDLPIDGGWTINAGL